MKIVCIGDSLTFGYGVNQNESWFAKVSEELASIEFVNTGIPGNTTKDMLLRFEKDVVEVSPKYVLVMGGTNDILMGAEIDEVTSRIIRIVNDSKLNKIVPILVIQPPINEHIEEKTWFLDCDYKKANEKIESFREHMIKEMTTSNTNYIDIYGRFNELLKNRKVDECYLDDGIHLTKDVHEYISREIVRELKRIVV